MSSSDDVQARLEFAVAIAREAGQSTLRYFRRDDLGVESKADASPVTVADREAEQLLRERIGAKFPADGILGEEFGEKAGASEYRWILDPIDGTRSFVRGVGLYGTLVAVERDGDSILGVIYIPASDECVYARTGHGAWYSRSGVAPIPSRVSKTPRLAEALFCTSDPRGFRATGRPEIFDRLCCAASTTRTWGDCYGYLLVATGRADLMVDPNMNLWDTAALKPIIEEAGGSFTDFQGSPTIHGGESIATNDILLAEVLKITRGGDS